jgi:hypothetical protein
VSDISHSAIQKWGRSRKVTVQVGAGLGFDVVRRIDVAVAADTAPSRRPCRTAAGRHGLGLRVRDLKLTKIGWNGRPVGLTASTLSTSWPP